MKVFYTVHSSRMFVYHSGEDELHTIIFAIDADSRAAALQAVQLNSNAVLSILSDEIVALITSGRGYFGDRLLYVISLEHNADYDFASLDVWIDADESELQPEVDTQAQTHPLGLAPATVGRVIDGDILELTNGARVRLIGVDAPEIGESGANEAIHFVTESVSGITIWLESHGSNTDSYGRLRRYVWLQEPTDTRDEVQIRSYQLNALLLENGHADVFAIGEELNDSLFRQVFDEAQPLPTPPQQIAQTTGSFIGNINSLVFHRSSCGSLPAPQNRIYFETRVAAENAGHRPCRRCSP